MSLAVLNAAVTEAILRAERADYHASRLWDEVAVAEQAIVDAAPPGSLEADIARRGVTTALERARYLRRES